MNVNQLNELGLFEAARRLEKGREFKRKMALAYEHYRFVSPDIFERFKKELRAKTEKRVVCSSCKGGVISGKKGLLGWGGDGPAYFCRNCDGDGFIGSTYDSVSLQSIQDYEEIPPMDCLIDLKKAKDLNCFDHFQVAKVETVEVRPDPIIFGIIEGCRDKFFITQWDNDIKIQDILREGEG